MKDRVRMFFGTRTGKVICGILILFLIATSAYGTAVQVINFPVLMTMIQKMVTQAIMDKIKSVWNESNSCSKSERSLRYLRRRTSRCTSVHLRRFLLAVLISSSI